MDRSRLRALRAQVRRRRIAPSADSAAARALLAEAISTAALRLNATRMASPAGSALAETYEEIGFAPALFLQCSGPESRGRRRTAIDRLPDLPLLELGRTDPTFRRRCSACDGSICRCWPAQQPLGADESVAFRRPRYVVTHYPRFRKLALSEARAVDPLARDSRADSARTFARRWTSLSMRTMFEKCAAGSTTGRGDRVSGQELHDCRRMAAEPRAVALPSPAPC